MQCSPSPGAAAPRAGEPTRSGRSAAAALIAALALAPGCVREAAKEATHGTLEALERGAQDGAGPAGGSAKGARERERPLVGSIVHDAVRAGAAEIGRQAEGLEPVIAQTSEAVSSAVVEGALQHDRALVTLVEQGTGAAARAAAREGTAELMEQLAGCPAGDPGCSSAAIERASRAAATGFADGLGRAIQPWIIGLAFGGGVLLAALLAVAIAVFGRRHERSAAH
ncbi:hypothetical protein predicted by Glimmer/Critica [Sorangium cellulosum So ce56]|uniref:Uncharacterized protein n=1 Tax=Sorangium cellulosum (strain So ce56) TaxID=448385 RepID=A9FU91_SORC5|nr:hypothetical protein [Sorangium cellulosum]CAN98609.1 hypothetical protein predicted by Glimmer/Critica [Sorangium cellulosum So ce56]